MLLLHYIIPVNLVSNLLLLCSGNISESKVTPKTGFLFWGGTRNPKPLNLFGITSSLYPIFIVAIETVGIFWREEKEVEKGSRRRERFCAGIVEIIWSNSSFFISFWFLFWKKIEKGEVLFESKFNFIISDDKKKLTLLILQINIFFY